MPLFPYLPLIVWMGLLEIVVGAMHDREQDAQCDLANQIMGASIIPFPTVVSIG